MDEINRRLLFKLLGAGSGAVVLARTGLTAGAARAEDPRASPAERSLTERIADYIVDARFEHLRPEVIRKVKEQIVYFLGGAFEVTFREQGRQALALARQNAHAENDASVIGQSLRLTPSDAAFVNGALFGAELSKDDTLGELHPGVITVPAALAIGEARRVSGRELILAIVQGYEVLAKLDRAASAWSAPMPRRGTNVYGGFGPVTAAGRLLKLDRQRMANALGYAAHLCMGLPEGSMMQHYYAMVARNGVFAAQLAEAGARPFSRYTIEGELGLYRSFFGKVPRALPKLIDSLAYSEILNAVQKRFPGTGANTTAIELLADTVERNQLDAANVSRIEMAVNQKGSFVRAREVSNRGPFLSARQASQSLVYWAARVLLDGKIEAVRLGEDNALNDADAANVMERISVTFEPNRSNRWARVIVHTRDGRRIERESEMFSYPFPPESWESWLVASGKRLLSARQLARLEDLIRNLEDIEDASMLLAATLPQTHPRARL